jgi:hypothetical protein
MVKPGIDNGINVMNMVFFGCMYIFQVGEKRGKVGASFLTLCLQLPQQTNNTSQSPPDYMIWFSLECM